MTKNIHSLDPQSAHLLRTLSATQGRVFTAEDAFRIFKLSRQSVYDRLSDLARGGWIVRLKPGVYFISPLEAGAEGGVSEHEFVIASYLVSPYAIGLWSALNHYGFTEQIPDRVYVLSTNRVSKPVRKIGSAVYQIVHVPRTRFFGTQEIWFDAKKAVLTDPERTLLDAFLAPQHCGGMTEVTKSFKSALASGVDPVKLTRYGRRIGKGVVFKRMGVLMDRFRPGFKERNEWRTLVSAGISLLDPQGRARGPIVSAWNVKVNMELDSGIS